jgi:hypothetical protein
MSTLLQEGEVSFGYEKVGKGKGKGDERVAEAVDTEVGTVRLDGSTAVCTSRERGSERSAPPLKMRGKRGDGPAQRT